MTPSRPWPVNLYFGAACPRIRREAIAVPVGCAGVSRDGSADIACAEEVGKGGGAVTAAVAIADDVDTASAHVAVAVVVGWGWWWEGSAFGDAGTACAEFVDVSLVRATVVT